MTSRGPKEISYRCVCGQVFLVETTTGGACPACTRRIAAKALAGALTETVNYEASPDESIVAAELVHPATGSGDQQNDDLDDRVGRQYGHYRVVRKLGQGGMGAVYEALDESLQRYVALKVIHHGVRSTTDTDQIQRLLQEAIAQARVNHPNVVHIYFVDTLTGTRVVLDVPKGA
jgi:hypothetical protein